MKHLSLDKKKYSNNIETLKILSNIFLLTCHKTNK